MPHNKLRLLVAKNANERIDIRTCPELRVAEDTDVVPLGLLRLLELPGETVHADYKWLASVVICELAHELLQAVDRGMEILRKPGFSAPSDQARCSEGCPCRRRSVPRNQIRLGSD